MTISLSHALLAIVILGFGIDAVGNLDIGPFSIRFYQIILVCIFPVAILSGACRLASTGRINRNNTLLISIFLFICLTFFWAPNKSYFIQFFPFIVSILISYISVIFLSRRVPQKRVLELIFACLWLVFLSGIIQVLLYISGLDYLLEQIVGYEIKDRVKANMRGFFYESNWYALALLTLAPAALEYVRRYHNSQYALYVLLIGAFLIFSQGRAAFAAYVIYIAITNVSAKNLLFYYIPGMAALTLMYTFLSDIHVFRLPTMSDPSGISRIEAFIRSYFFMKSSDSFNFWFGHGLTSWATYGSLLDTSFERPGFQVDNPGRTGSSFWASAWVQFGTIGILMIFWFIFRLRKLTAENRYISDTWIVFMVASAFYPSFNQLPYFVILPLVLGSLNRRMDINEGTCCQR